MRPGPPGTGFRQHEKADTRCDPPSHSMPNEASTLSQHIAQPDAVIVASRDALILADLPIIALMQHFPTGVRGQSTARPSPRSRAQVGVPASRPSVSWGAPAG